MMKRLVMIFVFLTSTTYSGISVSNDVAVSSTTHSGTGGVAFSWVVKNDEIYFCSAKDWHKNIVRCVKATETDSN